MLQATLETSDPNLSVHDLLGVTLMLEIRDGIAIPETDLAKLWLGLDPKHLPKARGPRDAFRKAFPTAKPNDGYQFLPYKGEAKPDEVDLAAVLVRTTEARSRMALTHQNRSVATLDHQGTLKILEAEGSLPQEKLLMQAGQERYDAYRQQVDGVLIRYAVMALLKAAHGFPLRDGVLVLPFACKQTVQNVAALLRALSDFAPRPNKTIIIEYGNTPGQAMQLVTCLNEHVTKITATLAKELENYKFLRSKDGKAIGHEKIATIDTELLSLKDLINAYENAFGCLLIETRTRFDDGVTQIWSVL